MASADGSEPEPSPEKVLQAFSCNMRRTIASTKEAVAELGIEEFSKKGLGNLMGMLAAYKDLWVPFHCKTSAECSDHLKKLAVQERKNPQFQEAMEDVFSAENEYDRFMDELDEQLNSSGEGGGSLLEVAVQALEEPTSDVSLRDILVKSDKTFTWFVLLRHFA